MDAEQFLSKSHTYILGNGPRYSTLEKVAGELAGVYYDAARSSGLDPGKTKWKTSKAFAKANFEKFIPCAVKYFIEMLGRQDIPDLCKQEIYDALIERSNDKDLKHLFVTDEGTPTFIWDHQRGNPFLRKN